MFRLYKPSPIVPAGFYAKLHGTFRGLTRWQVLDERGVPEIPRNPSGVPIGPVEGVENPNLITDLFLDRVAGSTYLMDPNANLINGQPPMRRHLAVGTGSTAPNVADTTLDSEAQRAATSAGFGDGSQTYAYVSADELFRCTSIVTRVVQMTANRNLTEYGFAPNTSGDIVIRELFRDGIGNPVTISLLNGKSIRLDHTLFIELPAPDADTAPIIQVDIEEYDAANTLVDTFTYDAWFRFQSASTSSATIRRLYEMWTPGLSTFTRAIFRLTAAPLNAPITGNANTFWPATDGFTATIPAYVNGSYERIRRYTTTTAQWNAALPGFTMRSSGGPSDVGGLTLAFDDPATYTKASTDTLRVGFVSTWSRA